MTKPVDIEEPPRQDEIILEMREVKEAYAKEFNCDAHAILDRLQQRAFEEGVDTGKREPRRVELKESA
ncbi:MAG: hypothetical protein MPN21_28190 [Thermoanaerobaculia bacterium]|nr:hypothetical protein [Thermoanaerobaculia bacterium]